jgi:chromosome segregation ATPase
MSLGDWGRLISHDQLKNDQFDGHFDGGLGDRHRSDQDSDYDFERLERAVTALTLEHANLKSENQGLREKLDERDCRLGALDERLLEMNQRRQDAIKRIDELVSQVDLLIHRCGSEAE